MWEWVCNICIMKGIAETKRAAKRAAAAHDHLHFMEFTKWMIERGLIDMKVKNGETYYRFTEKGAKRHPREYREEWQREQAAIKAEAAGAVSISVPFSGSVH